MFCAECSLLPMASLVGGFKIKRHAKQTSGRILPLAELFAQEQQRDAAAGGGALKKPRVDEPVTSAVDHAAIGAKCAEAGDWSGALMHWNAHLQVNPQDFKVLEEKAQVLLELGNYFEAIRTAEFAIRIDPNYSFSLLTLSRAQLEFGEPFLAMKNAQRAAFLRPDLTECRDDVSRLSKIISNIGGGSSCQQKDV
eukprot:TRINITY_DN11479_c0_g1_i1.p1 TRINITY_DN11479_c0_g1~~TRINITY_DN11479_c0_g1_i1.p1  ORF type:complete len:195 (-),score=49.93 TRINITY_DN11479_c0_g1_i1:181-765(-)